MYDSIGNYYFLYGQLLISDFFIYDLFPYLIMIIIYFQYKCIFFSKCIGFKL